MSILARSLRKKAGPLLTEVLIIVAGVLIALAVDEWRDELAVRQQEQHVLRSLLVDLEEDYYDFRDFVATAQRRARAADFLLAYAADEDVADLAWDGTPQEAIFQLAVTSRLQPTRSAFDEMNATGAGRALHDRELVSAIARYYSLAQDRSSVNELILPEKQRFRVALEQLGMSYADRERIDVDRVLSDPTALALIRSLRSMAAFAPEYCNDLIEQQEEVIAAIRSAIR